MPSREVVTDSNRRTVTQSENITYVQDKFQITAVTMNTFTANDTTPSVAAGKYFKTANTVATTITDFDNAIGDGHHIFIYIADDDTIIAHDATKIDLPGAVSRSFLTGDAMEFVSISGVWKGWSSRVD